MPDAYRLDCDATPGDCRAIIQSEDESEAISLAQNHMQEVHNLGFSEEELRENYLEVV